MAVITLVATAMLSERTRADLAEDDEREPRTGPRMEPSRLRRPVTPS
jgi:hypothetical protein